MSAGANLRYEKFGQFPRIVGLFLQGLGVAEAFPFKINGIDFMAPQAQIPVIAKNALKDLLLEKVKRSVIKLHRREDAVGVEPGLKRVLMPLRSRSDTRL